MKEEVKGEWTPEAVSKWNSLILLPIIKSSLHIDVDPPIIVVVEVPEVVKAASMGCT